MAHSTNEISDWDGLALIDEVDGKFKPTDGTLYIDGNLNITGTFIGTGGLINNLTDLNNVTITSVADYQQLRYDSGTSQWINSYYVRGSENLNLTNHGLPSLTTGSTNTFVGSNSGYACSSGVANSGFGRRTLYALQDGASNVSVGSGSLFYLVSGDNNVGVGVQCLEDFLGSNTCGYGTGCLQQLSTGAGNCGFGHRSGNLLETGYNNTIMGYEVLLNNVSGYSNVALGYRALKDSSASGNTVIGTVAGQNAGNSNVIVGSSAYSSSGSTNILNTIVGTNAMDSSTTGYGCSFGAYSGRVSVSQTCNFGYSAGRSAGATGNAHNANVLVGNNVCFYADSVSSANAFGYNVCIGDKVFQNVNSKQISSSVAIGNQCLKDAGNSTSASVTSSNCIGHACCPFISSTATSSASQYNNIMGYGSFIAYTENLQHLTSIGHYNFKSNITGNLNETTALGSECAINATGNLTNCLFLGRAVGNDIFGGNHDHLTLIGADCVVPVIGGSPITDDAVVLGRSTDTTYAKTIKTDTITEYTVDNGIDIEGVNIKDGVISGATMYGIYGEMYIYANSSANIIYASGSYHPVYTNMTTGSTNDITFESGDAVAFSFTAVANNGGEAQIETVATHGYSTGDLICVNDSSVAGYIGYWTITVVDTTHFVLDGSTYSATASGHVIKPPFLVCNTTGLYHTSMSCSASSGASNQTFNFAIFKNDSIVEKAFTERKFATTDIGSVSGNGIISLTSGDKISVAVNNTTASNSLTIKHMNLTMVKM